MADTKSTTAAKADEKKATAPAKDADGTSTDESGLTDEQRETAAKAENENLGLLGAAQAVGEAAGRANQERQATQLGERQAAISVGNDPETADDKGGKEATNGPFAGQLLSTDHYAAVTTEFQGRQVVEIRPAGWVGPGFEFPATRIKEVQKLLGQVKSLPKQD